MSFSPSIYYSKIKERLLEINSELKEGKCWPLNALYVCVPVGCSDRWQLQQLTLSTRLPANASPGFVGFIYKKTPSKPSEPVLSLN